jgi:hypothetical protein
VSWRTSVVEEFRAVVRASGDHWRATVPGHDPVTVVTPGDAKREAEGLAQRMLLWRMESETLWIGEPPTDEQFYRLADIYVSSWGRPRRLNRRSAPTRLVAGRRPGSRSAP